MIGPMVLQGPTPTNPFAMRGTMVLRGSDPDDSVSTGFARVGPPTIPFSALVGPQRALWACYKRSKSLLFLWKMCVFNENPTLLHENTHLRLAELAGVNFCDFLENVRRPKTVHLALPDGRFVTLFRPERRGVLFRPQERGGRPQESPGMLRRAPGGNRRVQLTQSPGAGFPVSRRPVQNRSIPCAETLRNYGFPAPGDLGDSGGSRGWISSVPAAGPKPFNSLCGSVEK